MSLMNGAPYWSPPSRNQRCLVSILAGPATGPKPTLDEMPALVAKAIKQGLIIPPHPSEITPVVHRKLADWQTASCTECGASFERGRREMVKCHKCRQPEKQCSGCGNMFRPPDRKKVCCSKECSRLIQVASFKAQHTYTQTQPKVAECIVCHQIRPVRPSGSGVAKTCSPECATVYRAQKNAERTKK